GHDYVRGSIVVTRKDNANFTGRLAEVVGEVAAQAGVRAAGGDSGMGAGGLADLGGEYFDLLEQPRIALLGREAIWPHSFGEVWYLIDHVLGLRASYLNAAQLGGADIRRYNVLVIPDGRGSALKDRFDSLKAWVQSGGTLIAIGSSAAAIADPKSGIGSV